MKTIGAIFFLLISLFGEIDDKVSDLREENDAHRYSYELENFRSKCEKALNNSDRDSVDNYEFKNLKKIHVGKDSTLLLYYFKTINNTHYLNWIYLGEDRLGPSHGRFFTDEIACACRRQEFNSQTENLSVGNYTYHHLNGIEVIDEYGNQLYCVPDIRLRLNLEIISDIRIEREKKEVALRIIDDRLTTLLTNVDVMNLDLSGLPRLKVIESPTKTLRVATYMVVYDDFSSKCFGYVIHHSDKGVHVTQLEDESSEMRVPERAKTNPKHWYGAIYTSMVETKIGKQTYYTLMGFNSNDGLVKTRVIEALTFMNEKCVFGSPIFIHERGNYGRRIFRYSSQANMMMRYDENLQMLVFDHLSPSNTMFKGEYRFYGPDFSFDGYELTKKGWVFKEDIDLRNP